MPKPDADHALPVHPQSHEGQSEDPPSTVPEAQQGTEATEVRQFLV